jgi:transposase-like protein
MIDKEELLNNKDFYKSFKNGEDLTSFFKQMHKRAVEDMLEAELDAHLDNEKHARTKDGNYRNGHGHKKIKSSFGESEIKVPRDRAGSFEPALVPKRHNIIEGLENIIISFYAKGMSVSDITNAVATEVVSWQNRPLEDLYLIVWMDGIVFKVRENSKVINKTVYLAVGLNRDGRKEVLGCGLARMKVRVSG